MAAQIRPTILVLGGAGFIGRELIRQLVASGHQVRAMIRGSTALLDELDPDQVELVRGDIRREEDLRTAMDGVAYVYHLAVGHAKTWQEYQSNEVDSTRLVGTLCLACGVKRLIFTGTIDSYYAGRKAGLIVAVLAYSIPALLTASADSVGELSTYRFLAGLGIGGAVPNTIALLTENFVPVT